MLADDVLLVTGETSRGVQVVTRYLDGLGEAGRARVGKATAERNRQRAKGYPADLAIRGVMHGHL